jgi:DMSO/TMAO reductase YedYZ molybdopterin-dependent catalytic subunit
LYADLSRLDPDALVTPTERFYIRTREPDRIDRGVPWTIDASGLAGAPRRVPIAEILEAERAMGVHLLECSGNARSAAFGLLSAAEWGGMPLIDFVDLLAPRPEATRVVVSGFDEHSVPSSGMHSTPGAAWSFTLEQVEDAGAFLATTMNGEALTPDHGAPIRLLMPGWYGCTCIKWVDRITLVGDDEPATSQMIEFAGRTHQGRAFELARDYAPAEIQPAAMPVRVERWRVDDQIVYRVVGILWGNTESSRGLEVRFADGPWEPVRVCPARRDRRTWSLWSHLWAPVSPGVVPIVLRLNDPTVRSIRLEAGYYRREVEIEAS